MLGITSIRAAAQENKQSAYAKTKTQISCAVTAQLISAFVFAEGIVQFLFFLNPKFQASSGTGQFVSDLVEITMFVFSCSKTATNDHLR